MKNLHPSLAERFSAIAQLVADACGITVDQLRAKARPEYVVVPRMLAYLLQAEATGARPEVVGVWWGKSRGTVAHGIAATRNRIETIPSCRRLVEGLRVQAAIASPANCGDCKRPHLASELVDSVCHRCAANGRAHARAALQALLTNLRSERSAWSGPREELARFDAVIERGARP